MTIFRHESTMGPSRIWCSDREVEQQEGASVDCTFSWLLAALMSSAQDEPHVLHGIGASGCMMLYLTSHSYHRPVLGGFSFACCIKKGHPAPLVKNRASASSGPGLVANKCQPLVAFETPFAALDTHDISIKKIERKRCQAVTPSFGLHPLGLNFMFEADQVGYDTLRTSRD